MRRHGYSSVLDIGCGNGRFLEEAINKNFQHKAYLWIDNSVWMIIEARKLHPNNDFEVIWMQDLSQISETFDSLLFLASFHHIETRAERIQVLKDAKQIVQPNGRIYLTNWNLLDQPRYKQGHRWNGDFDIKIGAFSRYYHGFTTQELVDIFRETGYKIIENRVFEGGRNFLSILSIYNSFHY
jgi:tRNA (uracil-5-)-methyltransferase TRM9